MDITVKEGVVRQRAEILQSFVALAVGERSPDAAQVYRAKAEHLIEQLETAERTIAFLTPKPHSPYARCEVAIEAIMAYLKDFGRPAAEQKIINGVLEGGWLGAKHGADLRVHKSILAYVSAPLVKFDKKANKEVPNPMWGLIKERNGLIGLSNWPDEMFV